MGEKDCSSSGSGKAVAMNFEDMSPELQEKAKACKTPEDILKLAAEAGYDLSDDELESVSGGGSWCEPYGKCSQANYGCGMVGH